MEIIVTEKSKKLSGANYSCNTCFAWVNESKAITEEGHAGRFCSAECLEKWRATQRQKEQEKINVTNVTDPT